MGHSIEGLTGVKIMATCISRNDSHSESLPISRPGRRQGLLYKHLIHSLTHPLVPTALQRHHVQTVRDSFSSHSDKELLKSQRASKSHPWFKSNGHFSEGADFANWWSCIGKGLRLQPVQQACFDIYMTSMVKIGNSLNKILF